MIRLAKILDYLLYVGVLAALIPAAPFLHWWVLAVLGSGFLWAVSPLPVAGRLLRLGVAGLVLCLIGILIPRMSRTEIVLPLVEILCLLLAERLIGPKSPRHILQIFLLALVVLGASSLLTLNMVYLGCLVTLVTSLTMGLIVLSFVAADSRLSFSRNEFRLLGKVLLTLPAGSLLLMGLLFFILPRTQLPLWNFLNPPARSTIGMTDRIRPGSVAELVGNNQVAFRAETERLPVDKLYWRGVVLNRIAGASWLRTERIPPESYVSGNGPQQQVAMQLEAQADRYLVSLDHSADLNGLRYEQTADGIFLRRGRDRRQQGYLMNWAADSRRQLRGSMEFYLARPDTVSSRLAEVAAGIRALPGGFAQKVQALEDFFRAQQLSYSAQNIALTEQPVDYFLFESKRGYCEYFASSFATLLRLAGIPSRLVGGYLGGDYNELGGYYLVTENRAHVWVEALDEQGIWQRLDPSRLAVNAEQSFARQRGQGLSNWQIFTDTLALLWTRSVLNYDLQGQLALLKAAVGKVQNAGTAQSEPTASQAPFLVGLSLFLVLSLAGGWFLRRFSVVILVRDFRRKVARQQGLSELTPSIGLYQAAGQLKDPLSDEFAGILGRSLYTDQPLTWQQRWRLRRIIKLIKWL